MMLGQMLSKSHIYNACMSSFRHMAHYHLRLSGRMARGPIMMARGPIMMARGPIMMARGPIMMARGPIMMARGPIMMARGPIMMARGPIMMAMVVGRSVGSMADGCQNAHINNQCLDLNSTSWKIPWMHFSMFDPMGTT